MPIDPNKKRHSYGYTTDFGVVFEVVISVEHATGAGFAAGNLNLAGLPRRWKMRQVHGATAAGRHTSIPCGTLAAASNIIANGTFPWDGDTFRVTGYTGEHWTSATVA